MPELKPCKCGGKGEVIKLRFANSVDYFVKCGNCDLRTKLYQRSKQNAVKAWNNGRIVKDVNL
jgi:hypothetical protein